MRLWMGLIGLLLLAMPAMAEDFDNPKVLLRDIYTRLKKAKTRLMPIISPTA